MRTNRPDPDRGWNCATQIPAVKTAAVTNSLEVRRVIHVQSPFREMTGTANARPSLHAPVHLSNETIPGGAPPGLV
jgi:hypothetical protein